MTPAEELANDPGFDDTSEEGQLNRIQTFQRLLLQEITPQRELRMLSETDRWLMSAKLECALYCRLSDSARDDRERYRYDSRVMFQRDLIARFDDVFERGFAIGFQQGLADAKQARTEAAAAKPSGTS